MCGGPQEQSQLTGRPGPVPSGGADMTEELKGKQIAFLVANEGVEQVELTEPWAAVERAGGTPLLVATEAGTVQAFDHLDKADTFDVDLVTSDLALEDFAGVVLPGGVANPDQL